MNADVIVVGLGAMGSATAYHLARRGAKVLAFDAFPLGHDRGSSHGESRLIRRAYFESPAYVPLLNRAYTLWDEVAEERKCVLLERTGLVSFTRRGAVSTLEAARRVAKEHGIQVEELDAIALRTRFPVFRISDDMEALWEPGAGFLHVERCVRAHGEAAIARGAHVEIGGRVDAWAADARGVSVNASGTTHRAQALVLCPGAWGATRESAGGLLGGLRLPLSAHRVVQFWFDASEVHDIAHGMPCFAFSMDGVFVYGFPRLGALGMKVAEHRAGERVEDPALVRRTVELAESEVVARFVRTYFDGISTTPLRAKTCMYTMTPDEHFVVDRHPLHENVHYAVGFSGHGFKFASVIGEYLAARALGGPDDSTFSFLKNRFA